MDFHSMKRKDLQALCKKHDIPANLTNLDMANNLTSLFKGGEKPLVRGGSCLKRRDEIVRANYSDVETQQSKKAKLNLENEITEFANSSGRISKTGSRVRPVANKGGQAVENVDEFESSKENVDKTKSSKENVNKPESFKKIGDKPVTVRRSRVQTSVEGDLVKVPNPPVEKKRSRRAVKDVHTTTDKPPPLAPLPPSPPPTVVELSDNAANEEPGLPKKRSWRKKGVVESSDGPLPNPSFEKKREGRAAKDVDTSDKPPLLQPMLPPPPTIAELSNNAANEEPRLPKRRSMRKKGVAEGGEVPIPNPSVEKKIERKAAKDVNTGDKPPPPPGPTPMPPQAPPGIVELSDNAINEEPRLPKRRSMRKTGVAEGGEVPIPNPSVEKKRERKASKDVNTSDKPPLPPTMPLPPAPPTVAELSDNAANEEPGLPKRSSMRKKGVVEGGDVPIPNPSVEKKRERGAAKDDHPPPSVVGLSNDAAAQETRMPRRRLLRNREVAGIENGRSPKPSNSVCKTRMPLQPLSNNIRLDTPNLDAKSGVVMLQNHPVELKKERSVVKDVDLTNRINNAGAEEMRKPTRRSLRTKENVDIVVSRKNKRKTILNKRSAKGSDEVPKTDAVKATGDITQPEKTSKRQKRDEAECEESSSLKEELRTNEKVKEQRVTLEENGQVLQLEEPLQRKGRNYDKRRCIIPQVENDDKVTEVDTEISLKRYICRGREYDRALNFPNRAGDIGSSNFMDTESRVGRARGGVVFWCNGSGCFALPKW